MATLSIQSNHIVHSPSTDNVEMSPQEFLNRRNQIIKKIALGEINNPNLPSTKERIFNFLGRVKEVITGDIAPALFEAALVIINDRNGNGENNEATTFILEAIKTHKNMEESDYICEEPVSPICYEQPAVEDSKPLSARVRLCPGHCQFFHHYSIYSKAKRKAEEEVQRYLQNSEIKTAEYTLFEKNTAIGQESGYFNLLNAVFYKYAVAINYTHVDDSKECLY